MCKYLQFIGKKEKNCAVDLGDLGDLGARHRDAPKIRRFSLLNHNSMGVCVCACIHKQTELLSYNPLCYRQQKNKHQHQHCLVRLYRKFFVLIIISLS